MTSNYAFKINSSGTLDSKPESQYFTHQREGHFDLYLQRLFQECKYSEHYVVFNLPLTRYPMLAQFLSELA